MNGQLLSDTTFSRRKSRKARSAHWTIQPVSLTKREIRLVRMIQLLESWPEPTDEVSGDNNAGPGPESGRANQ